MTDGDIYDPENWNRTEAIALAMAGLVAAFEGANSVWNGLSPRSVTLLTTCAALAATAAYGHYYRVMYERHRTFGGGD